MKPVYIIIGIPGSGKNTQGKLLSEYMGLPHIDAGDTFTEVVRSQSSKYWEEIRDTYSKGPISSELFMKIMGEVFSSERCAHGFILTQNTKSVEEINQMVSHLHTLGFEIKIVFSLDVDKDTGIERNIKRWSTSSIEKEPDLETLKHRVSKYDTIFADIKTYYKDKGLLVEIDGTQPTQDVFENIIKYIHK